MADALTTTEFQDGVNTVVGDISDLSQKLDILSSDLSQKLDGVNNGLESVRDAVISSTADSVDYSDTLSHVGQLMAVTDILLVILCVMMFLACGLFCGYQVTKWLKTDAR